MRHLGAIVGVSLFAALCWGSPAMAQEKGTIDALFADKEFAEKAGAAVGLILLLAILIENALAVIFNWRLFLTCFSLRGVKTPILIIVSGFIVAGFDLDIFAQLFNISAPGAGDEKGNLFTATLTALILSGGSSGVHSLMRAMGLRSDEKEKQLAPVPPKDKAWIAVRVTRSQSVGLIQVRIDDFKGQAGAAPPSAIAGTIHARRPSPLEILRRNINRFPENGGYTVEPGKHYKISVVWANSSGDQDTYDLSEEGFVFAPRAIVDFDVTL